MLIEYVCTLGVENTPLIFVWFYGIAQCTTLLNSCCITRTLRNSNLGHSIFWPQSHRYGGKNSADFKLINQTLIKQVMDDWLQERPLCLKYSHKIFRKKVFQNFLDKNDFFSLTKCWYCNLFLRKLLRLHCEENKQWERSGKFFFSKKVILVFTQPQQ